MDEPRLLTRSGVPAYTRSPAMALQHEPEAVPEDVQAELTWQAAAVARGQRTIGLQQRLAVVRREAEWHAAQARHKEREARRLERRLAV